MCCQTVAHKRNLALLLTGEQRERDREKEEIKPESHEIRCPPSSPSPTCGPVMVILSLTHHTLGMGLPPATQAISTVYPAVVCTHDGGARRKTGLHESSTQRK